MIRLSWFLLFCSLFHGLRATDLDNSLFKKKADTTAADTKVDEASSDAAEPHAQVVTAAPVVAPIITVSSTCTHQLCLKTAGLHVVRSPDNGPSWWQGYHDILKKNFRNADSHKFISTPMWDEADFCVKIRQQGDRTDVDSWYKHIPAGRKYFVFVGTAQYSEDKIGKKTITVHQDACRGKVELIFKYMIDIFITGDDLTETPIPSRHKIDVAPEADDGSKVHYRKGHFQFTGKLLTYMADWYQRKAFWIVDATNIDVADTPSLADSTKEETEVIPFSSLVFPETAGSKTELKAAYQSAGVDVKGAGFLVNNQQMAAYSHSTKSPVTFPVHSFGAQFSNEKSFRYFREHRQRTYSPKNKDHHVKLITDARKGTVTVSQKVGIVGPFGKIDSVCPAKRGRFGIAEAALPTTAGTCYGTLNGGHVAAPVTSLEKVTYTFQSWGERITYDKMNKRIQVVICGLFPKTFLKPKNCHGKKAEHEG